MTISASRTASAAPAAGHRRRTALPLCGAAAVATAVALATAAPLAAQITWIVDQALGPGAHFAALQPAVAWARHGDTIVVRAGQYSGQVVAKGLTLVGEPGAALSLTVQDLPAGRRVAVQGFAAAPLGSSMSLRRCAGSVHVDRMQLLGSGAGSRLVIEDCALVTLNAINTGGTPSLQVVRSTVVATGCAFTGAGALARGSVVFQHASPAVSADTATLTLVQCTATGGNGIALLAPAAPAIAATATTLVVGGDAQSTMQAGGAHAAPTAALQADAQTSVEIDPKVRLVPHNGGPPVGGGAVAVTQPVASVQATGAPPGAALQAVLLSSAGDAFGLFTGLPSLGVPTPFGPLHLDTRAWLLLAVGRQGASERTTWSLPLPPDPALAELPLALQAFSGPTSGWRLTAPAVVVLR